MHSEALLKIHGFQDHEQKNANRDILKEEQEEEYTFS